MPRHYHHATPCTSIDEDWWISSEAYRVHGSIDPQDWTPSASYATDEERAKLIWAWGHLATAHRAVLAPVAQTELALALATKQSSICERVERARAALRDLIQYDGDPDRDADRVIRRALVEGDAPTVAMVRVWAGTGRRQSADGSIHQRTANDVLRRFFRRHGAMDEIQRLVALHGRGRGLRFFLGADRSMWIEWDEGRSSESERLLAMAAEAQIFGVR